MSKAGFLGLLAIDEWGWVILWRMFCPFQGIKQYPWLLPARCQEHMAPPSKCFQALPNVPWGVVVGGALAQKLPEVKNH